MANLARRRARSNAASRPQLHPNFSGGPAIDDQGRVLGINTSALSRFAAVVIPASTVHRVAAELETKGPHRAWLSRHRHGAGDLAGRCPRIAQAMGDAGIMVMAVEPGTPRRRRA